MDRLPIPGFIKRREATAVAIKVDRQAVVAKRETMRLLPECVSSRAKWLGTVETETKSIPYLSSGLHPLSENERDAAQLMLAELNELTSDGGEKNNEIEEQEKLTLVVKLFLAKPSAAMTDMGAAARGEAYMLALYDLPAWAIAEAIKRWHRGDVDGFSIDEFKWAPDSAVLRRVAFDVMEPYRDNAKTIQRVLDARPLEEVLS
jgi:hypothetical protein